MKYDFKIEKTCVHFVSNTSAVFSSCVRWKATKDLSHCDNKYKISFYMT